MKRRPIVTLLSDFGLRDPYVAEMKAVVLSICLDATIIDISHEIGKYDVRMGAYTLARAASFFPKGTIHVAVVDPGVGTERRPIIAEAKRGFYVGPDNGLLMLSAIKEGVARVYEITNRNTCSGRSRKRSTGATSSAQQLPTWLKELNRQSSVQK